MVGIVHFYIVISGAFFFVFGLSIFQLFSYIGIYIYFTIDTVLFYFFVYFIPCRRKVHLQITVNNPSPYIPHQADMDRRRRPGMDHLPQVDMDRLPQAGMVMAVSKCSLIMKI